MSAVLAVSPLVQQGDTCSRSVRLSREDIAACAQPSGEHTTAVRISPAAVVGRGTLLIKTAQG